MFKGDPVHFFTNVSALNSSTTALSSGSTFTGTFEETLGFSSLMVSVKTDQIGTLYVDFSPDGTNVDYTYDFDLIANSADIHRITAIMKYYRVRITNESASNQTYLRMQVLLNNHTLVTSSLKSQVQQGSDALTVRSIDAEIGIRSGFYNGISIVNIGGLNSDIDSGTVPEDIWEGGGVYTGFPSSAQTAEIFSSSINDTSAGTGARTVIISGLDSNYNELSETVTLNGLTGVITTGSYLRIRSVQVMTTGATGHNEGTLTIRQSVATTNVFATLLATRNITSLSSYTVPAGKTAYLRSLFCSCATDQNNSLTGHLRYRKYNEPFLVFRPFFASNNFRYAENIYGGIQLTEKADIVIRITATSGTNIAVNGGYDLILIDN